MDGICDWDSGNPHARNHILTTLNPPASVELCDEHYGPGLIPLLAAELGLDPGPFYAYVEKYVKREQAKADRVLADAQAAEAAEGSDGPAADDTGNAGYETFHDVGRDLRAERKAGIGDDAQ